MRTWASALVAASLVVLPSVAGAQSGLTGRVRYLAGYTHERPPVLDSSHDVWTGVVPELSYLYLDEPRGMMRLTYAFTAAVHTRDAPEIANRLTLGASYDVSSRTTLLLLGDLNQTSLSNYLLTRPALDTSVILLPPANVRLLTSTGAETLAWQATQNLMLAETVEASYVTSLDPDVGINNFIGSLTLSADRSWQINSLGVDLRPSYASLRTEPQPEQKLVTVTAAPRWRHDFTQELSSSLSGGLSVVFSPDHDTRTIVLPYIRGSFLYTSGASSAELSHVSGTLPSSLTGQMLQSHLLTLRGLTPLSERYAVMLGGSVGYLHGSILDLRPNTVATADFDAVLADMTFSWQATDWLQLFARGLFTAQNSVAYLEPTVREAAIIGLQLSTRGPDGVAIPVRLPQRVDRGDAAAR